MLVATAQVVAVRGPKLKAVMSSMDRSLGKRLGTGTWDSVVATLMAGHVLANLLEASPRISTRARTPAGACRPRPRREAPQHDIGGIVRKLLTEAATAAAAAATAATVAAANG